MTIIAAALPHPPAASCEVCINEGPYAGEMYSLHCYSCGVDEHPKQIYRFCFECWHCYESPQELVLEHAKRAPFHTPPEVKFRKAEDITFCPLCLHDFI